MSNYVKIYGLEYEKKDPIDISCKYPGPTTDPSTIKIDTSVKDLTDSSLKLDVETFKKLEDCPLTFTLTKTNSAIDNSILFVQESNLLNNKVTYSYSLDQTYLLATKRYVYLGFKDSTDNFTGNYKVNEIVFDSDTTGCSAKSTLYTGSTLISNKNTGGLITYSLNNCTKDRVITFSYNSIPIFKIDLKYYKV